MRALLCLDIGMKRTGVAFSESGIVASPLLPVLERHSLIADVISLVADRNIGTLVIGMPNRIDDSPTPQTKLVEAVVVQLRDALRTAGLDPEIIPYNEFGSTRSAKRRFPDLDDNAGAATLLLQEYLDSTI